MGKANGPNAKPQLLSKMHSSSAKKIPVCSNAQKVSWPTALPKQNASKPMTEHSPSTRNSVPAMRAQKKVAQKLKNRTSHLVTSQLVTSQLVTSQPVTSQPVTSQLMVNAKTSLPCSEKTLS